MRRFTHFTTALLLAAATFFAVSCDDTEELTPTTPEDEYDAVLKVKEDSTNSTPDVTYDVTASTGETITAKVTFINTEGDNMKRLYVTANAAGTGDVVFKPLESSVNLKADGAIGLESGQGDEFSFEFDLPVPDSITVGTLVYTFWTTSGNGDPRDMEKRLAAGPGTITIRYGGSNPAAPVKSYSVVMLVPPAADLSSATFVSLTDGETYKIKDGAEYAALWDFGYYFTNQQQASFASTSAYEESFANLTTGETFINVDSIAGTTELNNFYFATSAKTSTQFDEVDTSSDLNAIVTPSEQKISGLAVGDIIEFVDNYGKKGLIRITDLSPGTSPVNNYIKFDIKVQP
jgi:hypothetical protein